ncbi:heme ABC transporter ATP-binding protein [Granulosicoccus antarcticus]|uniref:Hemin import ATP-binding protein HmuV n=1 Tax=Granulosicoccus antarcticus IMCC3135 TaxID=1192854 RepID=A0A2Z2P044_9GAMM|nr:heme ABC transporter ATP-binding protein [Granulosicoccus antarcticus]ASJ76883.1 Hemin import ATP-binding protein HmuV [Granulosicoccus antarcticus IMCC3135]
MINAEQMFLRGRVIPRVNKVSLTLHPGEVLAVLGPNGAGKSSVLKLLTGELQCHEGRVLIGNTDIRDMDVGTLALHRAVLPQESMLAFNFRVSDVVMMGRSPHRGCSESFNQELVAWAMQIVGVDLLANQHYMDLSGGERQRVHLARVLAQIGRTPPTDCYLLLDEPTAALDITHQHLVLTLARQLARTLRIGVLAILHDLNLAALYADRIALLKDGCLEAIGLPEDILTAAHLRSVFDVEASVLAHPHRSERLMVVTG